MDIDLDFPSTFDPTKVFYNAIPASRINKEELVKHSCGTYFQNIPVDDVTKLAAIPFKEAEKLGYFKIDFLHLDLLDVFKSKQVIRQLIKEEPNWDLLLDDTIVPSLFQVSKHYDTLCQMQPRSIQELADVIAIIRPGKMKHLQPYLKNRDKVRPLLYQLPGDEKSTYKRGHAIAYALDIILQLHLIERYLA